MSKVYPDQERNNKIKGVAELSSLSVWTVWKKSSMAFQGTDGFSFYDSNGRLAYRVDNYSRKNKYLAGELVLMDGHGKPVMTLRPQILSIHDRWNGFKIEEEEEEDDDEQKKLAMSRRSTSTHAFSMRRRSVLQSGDEAEVFMGDSSSTKMNRLYNSAGVPNFRVEGCFGRRCCKIKDGNGEEVACIARKKVNPSVVLGDDVFSLIVRPGFDCELIMAFVVIMDRICQKPYTPLMCY